MAATINWSTAAELLEADLPATATVEDPVDPATVTLLTERFPEVRQALDPEGLSLDDFEGFGPVQHFRDNFITGWHAVLEMIRTTRADAGEAPALR